MGGPFSLDDGFVAAASSNVEIGGKVGFFIYVDVGEPTRHLVQ